MHPLSKSDGVTCLYIINLSNTLALTIDGVVQKMRASPCLILFQEGETRVEGSGAVFGRYTALLEA
jgi:hypothetical protein